MVWSSFSFKGPGRMAVIQGTMNATKYLATLEDFLLPQIEEWFGEQSPVFQQDNAPCHKAVMITNFLNSKEIEVLPWPPYSPDLSPIENLWAMIKNKVHTIAITSQQQLATRINDIWCNDADIKKACESLILKMPRRIEVCIKAKGGPIKY